MSELNNFLIRLIQIGSLNMKMLLDMLACPGTDMKLFHTILDNFEKYYKLIRIVEKRTDRFLEKKQKESDDS